MSTFLTSYWKSYYTRRDNLCALCRKNVVNQTGSHMVPNLLASMVFTFEGLAKRDRELVEK